MYLNDKLPQGETETKVDPYTLPALIAWLRTKPAGEAYCFFSYGRCLLAQYFRFVGFKAVEVWGFTWKHGGEPFRPIPSRFNTVAALQPHTFGAALARAEALAREA